MAKAEARVEKAKSRVEKATKSVNELKKKHEQNTLLAKQAAKTYSGKPNNKVLKQKETTYIGSEKRLSAASKILKKQKRDLQNAIQDLNDVKGKHSFYGLSKKEFESQYKKTRKRDTAGYARAQEADSKKIDNAIQMLKRAVKNGFMPDYVLTDTWFYCYDLLKTVIEIGHNIHLISMARIGTAKYVLLQNGSEYCPLELINKFERKAKYSRKLKAHYIKLNATYQGVRVNMFFVKIGRSSSWHLLVTTDLNINFTKLFDVYKIRWCIEVFFKESKQFLYLGKCSSSDFDAQTADATLTMIRYILLSYHKKIHYEQSIGGLFKQLSQEAIEENLLSKIRELFIELINALAHCNGIDIITFYGDIIRNPEIEIVFTKIGIDLLKNDFSKVA